MVFGDLVFGLLVAVRDHAVEEAAGLALRVVVLLRLLDLTAKVAGGLVVNVVRLDFFVKVGWRAALVWVLQCRKGHVDIKMRGQWCA